MGVLATFVGGLLQYVPAKDTLLGESEQIVASLRLFEQQALSLLKNRVFLYSAGCFVAYKTWQSLCAPLLYIRRNPDVGYIMSENQHKLERANEVRRRRQTGDLPPVYPNGWYCILPSHELPKKGVFQAHVLGLDLAVFRSEEGKVGVVDAYCPHLGANIAAGGTVEGDTIRCPFHGWEFNCDGECVRIPYAKEPTKIPKDARVKKYTSLEINDQILIWFDAEGREPFWYPPKLDHVVSGSWSFRGKTRHFLNAHIQEVPENAADVAHLNYLHGPSLLNGVDLRYTDSRFQFLRHVWEASWAPCTEAGTEHMSVLKLVHRMVICGVVIPMLNFYVTATQIGPGLVYLTWESMFGKGVFIQSLTPSEPMMQELSHCIYADWKVPSFIAKFYMLGEAKQVERDVMVWNNKMYRAKPLLPTEDALIVQHRRWYKQFYSENSPTYASLRDGADW